MIILFLFLMFAVVGKLIWWSLKATWGLAAILLSVVFFPLVLIVMLLFGLMSFAFPILLVVGLVAMIAKPRI